MFCRNHRSRVTVARCSALEMEIRRGRFRRSMLTDPPQDTDIQKRIDHEVRIREGAMKLLGACTQKEQALEAAKSLLLCNSRIMTYMSELQHRKEEQVLQHATRRPSEGGTLEERVPCKGKLSISDLRIPLMWKDTEYFKNKGELHRCAVFCALQIRGEVYDTEMVFVDRTATDICFENAIVFSDVLPGFELSLQLYSCALDEDFALSRTPRRLSTKLSSSLGRSSGRRVRAAIDGAASNGGGSPILLQIPNVPGPRFQLLAHTKLTLAQVEDGFRTHDLTISSSEESSSWLPLYGSVCCRLTAQPDCMSREMMSGQLQIQAQGQRSTQRMFCKLRGCRLLCYRQISETETALEADLTVSVNKETKIRCSDREGHGFSITNWYGCEEVTHCAKAESREDLHLWMEAFWQYFYDMSQWKQCCDDLMKIETPPAKRPTAAPTKEGSLYHEMAIEGLGPIPDLLSQRMKEFELQRGLEPPPWTSFFHSPTTGPPSCSSSDCDSPPVQTSRLRPRTFSLDAKLTSLKNRGLKMAETQSPGRGSPRSNRKEGLHLEGRTPSTSGSSTPDSERGGPHHKNGKSFRNRCDPRWLQSQV